MSSTKQRATITVSASVPNFKQFHNLSVVNDHLSRHTSLSDGEHASTSDISPSVHFHLGDDEHMQSDEEKPTHNRGHHHHDNNKHFSFFANLSKKRSLFPRRHSTITVPQDSTSDSEAVYAGLHNEAMERHMEFMLSHRRPHSCVGILGMGKAPRKAADLVAKKRNGKELSWEDMEFFIRGMENGSINDAQSGALLMAFDLVGLSLLECESLMKAMMFSGQLLNWPGEWGDCLASLQSIGSTGNKAKPIVAAAMAAIGLKFPIMSSRGTDVFASILNKLNTIPNFDGKKTFTQIEGLLNTVGCCIVKQPPGVAPAETHIRNITSQIGCSDNNSIKAACLMARVCAMQLRAVLLEITCGPSESIHSKAEAKDLVIKLQEMAKVMGVRCKVVLTHVDGPVGCMIGQSLEVAETIRTLNGDGPDDFHELVCKIGGHVLHEMNRVDTPANGEKLVGKVLKDGSAKRKFMQMLQAQGVGKATVKAMFKHIKKDMLPAGLPVAQYFTHLSTSTTGYVHRIDTTICNNVMFELSRKQADGADADEDNVGRSCAGGIQLLVQVESFLNRGECWAKIHHNVRLTEEQMDDLKHAITISLDTPLYDMTIDMQEVSLTSTHVSVDTPL